MDNQGMRMFCSRRVQAGLIHEVQIAVVNGEITSVKYTFYVRDPPESYEAKKDSEDFWENVDTAVFLLAFEPEVHEDMWDALSPEFVKNLHDHKIYRDGGWERLSEMSLEELQAEMDEMKREHPELEAEFETIEWMNHQSSQQLDDIEEEKLAKAIEDIIDPVTNFLKGKNLL